MNREEFDSLLALLDADREAAGRKYEEIRTRLIGLFKLWGCTESDSQADETFNRVARKAAEVRERSNPLPFIVGVARKVFLEWLRKQKRKDRIPEPSVQAEEEPDYRLEHVRKCLEILTAEQRRLLLTYHADEQRIRSRKILCEQLGIPMNALRIRVHRLRKKVETCVEEKLRDLSMKRF